MTSRASFGTKGMKQDLFPSPWMVNSTPLTIEKKWPANKHSTPFDSCMKPYRPAELSCQTEPSSLAPPSTRSSRAFPVVSVVRSSTSFACPESRLSKDVATAETSLWPLGLGFSPSLWISELFWKEMFLKKIVDGKFVEQNIQGWTICEQDRTFHTKIFLICLQVRTKISSYFPPIFSVHVPLWPSGLRMYPPKTKNINVKIPLKTKTNWNK